MWCVFAIQVFNQGRVYLVTKGFLSIALNSDFNGIRTIVLFSLLTSKDKFSF